MYFAIGIITLNDFRGNYFLNVMDCIKLTSFYFCKKY